MDQALAAAAAALALAALSLALQAFKLETLGKTMAAAAAGGEGELVRFPVGETPWAQRFLQVSALRWCCSRLLSLRCEAPNVLFWDSMGCCSTVAYVFVFDAWGRNCYHRHGLIPLPTHPQQ